MFRAIFVRALQRKGLRGPTTPKKWVAHCKHVGRGLPALKYLSRYLYRGVIDNRNIIRDDATFVTFRYKDGQSATIKTRRMRGEDFIALVLQHTLPKGFRRARDYRFLHGNAKRTLVRVQLILKVRIPPPTEQPRPAFLCLRCNAMMAIIHITPPDRPTA